METNGQTMLREEGKNVHEKNMKNKMSVLQATFCVCVCVCSLLTGAADVERGKRKFCRANGGESGGSGGSAWCTA